MKSTFRRIHNYKSFGISKNAKIINLTTKQIIPSFTLHNEIYAKLEQELEMLAELMANTYLDKTAQFKDIKVKDGHSFNCILSNLTIK